ncbi:MAG: alpha/beta hydrolase [Planctomycetota bacterium]
MNRLVLATAPNLSWLLAIAIAFSTGLPILRAQSVADERVDPTSWQGNWVGWLETPAQHLRLLVRVQTVTPSESEPTKSQIEGTITSLDQTPDAVPFADAAVREDGTLEFTVLPRGDSKLSYSFRGKRTGGRIEGTFENANAKLPLSFQKTESLPDEGFERLGADSAWKGELNIAVQKIAVRFRIYDKPPYADPSAPRIFFDSLTEKAYGFPVQPSLEKDDQIVLRIPSLPGNAKYIVPSELTDRIRGRFIQSLLPIPLELSRVEELSDRPLADDPLLLALKGHGGSAAPSASRRATPPEPPKPGINNSLPDGVREENFTIARVDYRKPKVKQDGRWTQPKFQISGTITWPANASADSPVPAVVMVSGSGPQDRDETIGSHKPFRFLAHWLAARGMASLRYDDRGVGESTGEFMESTTSEFAEDATAVWEHARTLDGIDRERVGLLGHSEGGIIGPMVAANRSEVGFLVLLAPPGLPGSEILSSQIDRIAEVQGVDAKSRQATTDLQRKLQRLALELDPSDEKTKGEVRQAILDRWDSLRGLSSSESTESEEVLQNRVVDQITAQFRGLQTPWMRFFLAFDPTSSWMVMRAPTLAIWGDKDVQVLAGPNREKLIDVATRNPKLRGDLVVLPDINHLMQRAKTGLPEEYDDIADTIDPSVLDVIQEWLKHRDLIP